MCARIRKLGKSVPHKTGPPHPVQPDNFGINPQVIRKFLHNHDVAFPNETRRDNFEKASADAVEYTIQVLCYR